MASQRLIWVDLEVRILRFIALFFLSHSKTKIGAKPKEVAGEVGFIGYPATTFVQNHFDYKVDGLDINVMVNWQLPPVADPDLSQVCVCVGGGGGFLLEIPSLDRLILDIIWK